MGSVVEQARQPIGESGRVRGRPLFLVAFVQGICDHEDLPALQRLRAESFRRRLDDISITPQQVREREIAPRSGMEVVVRFVHQNDRALAFRKRALRDRWPELRVGHLLRVHCAGERNQCQWRCNRESCGVACFGSLSGAHLGACLLARRFTATLPSLITRSGLLSVARFCSGSSPTTIRSASSPVRSVPATRPFNPLDMDRRQMIRHGSPSSRSPGPADSENPRWLAGTG